MTILKDVPSSFGAYAPENFDRRFLGPVTATDALNFSRNIPAVYVASQLRQPTFFISFAPDRRRQYGQRKPLRAVAGAGRRRGDGAGIGEAVCAAGEPRRAAAASYAAERGRIDAGAAAERGGQFHHAGYAAPAPAAGRYAGAAFFFAAGVLEDRHFLGLSRRLERRDFRPLRAGGVGRQLRRARQQCVGRRRGGRAAVLQHHRQRQCQLPRPAGTEAPVPQRLRRVDICLASGDLPTPWCQQKGKTWFIPGKSPIKVDSVYRPVVLDIHSGEVVCPPYDAAQTRTEIFEFWPSDLANVFAQAGLPAERRRSTAARTTASPSAATRRASLRR